MKKYSEEAKRVAAETIQQFGGDTFDALVDTIELLWQADAERKRLLQQADGSGSLPLIEKAIDDTFNQVHYSHLHPDVVNPIEHNEWRDKWIKENYGNNR